MLIRGESGVGKELVARAIHQRSSRKDRPFVKVNCAALPAELLESELFGHEKGAFTGAATTRIGKFEQADTGTIFLDEIGEMKAALQAKMLHVLQDGQFTKLGSNRPVNVDVRVVAATNRDLEAMMLRGEFREDLYYRLKVIEVTVPPLRERRGEIAHLTQFFIDRYARRYNRPRAAIVTDELAAALPHLRVAGQHPRTRKHDQADRHPAGRIAGDPRNDAEAAATLALRCRRRRRSSGGTARSPTTRTNSTPSTDDETADAEVAVAPAPAGSRLADVAEVGRDEGGADDDRGHVAAGALESPAGGRTAGCQLQDIAQQDQGVRHQQTMTGLRGAFAGVLLTLFTTVPATLRADTVQLSLHDGRRVARCHQRHPCPDLRGVGPRGGVLIVNAERVPGTPITVTLENVPEEQALDTLLRPVSGYLARRRVTAAEAGRSSIAS